MTKRSYIALVLLLAVPALVLAQQPQSPLTITVNGVSFKMILVQGGTFTMGCTFRQFECENDEYPTHKVTLSTYYIGETEVTQELWYAVMGSNPSRFKGFTRPVEMVSWEDCQEFIRRLNQLTGRKFRLPTEAEWEFAARGGTKSAGYKYSGSNRIGEVAWYDKNSGDSDKSSPDYGTHVVKTKKPNELGIYDMSGNVFEWCSDWYGNYTDAAQTNPQGASSGTYRVTRGGCWFAGAGACLISYRPAWKPIHRDSSFGLRLVLLP